LLVLDLEVARGDDPDDGSVPPQIPKAHAPLCGHDEVLDRVDERYLAGPGAHENLRIR
jgi:hypothetical protein